MDETPRDKITAMLKSPRDHMHSAVRGTLVVFGIVLSLSVLHGFAEAAKRGPGQRPGQGPPASSRPADSTQNTTPKNTPGAPSAPVFQAGAEVLTVPVEYRQLYDGASQRLDALDAYLNNNPNPRPTRPIFGAELLPANANRGTELLGRYALNGVKLYLDRLKTLNIQGVSISLNYPLLTPQFPNYARYVEFYRNVAGEVRKRNMKLMVDAGGAIFSGTSFTNLYIDYSDVTFDDYASGTRSMSQTIIDEMSPDYLSFGAEPDTAASNLGMPQLNTPEAYTEYVNRNLNGLDRKTTRVGAGGSSWGSIEFSKQLAERTTLDFIAVHIYPLSDQILRNVSTINYYAKRNNKAVVLDETWLYKAAPNEAVSNVAATEAIFKRDAYSFWAPLDQKFIRIMTKLSSTLNIEYISPFWTNFMFAYSDYDDVKNLSYADTVKVSNQKALTSIQDGTFSSTGLYYKKLINGEL